MAASYHKHAPWRKAFLVPFWVLQLLLELLLIALLALAESALVLWQGDINDAVDDGSLPNDFNTVVDSADHITIPIWIGVCVLLLSLTITEIVLLARHKLKPLTFLIMNVVKSGIWTVIFVLDVISAVDNSQSRSASFLAIIIDGVLVLCFWIPMIYGAVIYHRFRREKKSYVQVEAPGYLLQNEFGGHTEYPSQYKQFVQEEPVVDSNGMGRRLSYNHQRDTRFEDYRRASNPDFSPEGGDISGFPGSPPVPQVYVEHHDEAFKMEHNSRTTLR